MAFLPLDLMEIVGCALAIARPLQGAPQRDWERGHFLVGWAPALKAQHLSGSPVPSLSWSDELEQVR